MHGEPEGVADGFAHPERCRIVRRRDPTVFGGLHTVHKELDRPSATWMSRSCQPPRLPAPYR